MNLYLLLSLILSEGVSSLGEVRQAQEVHHLSLSIDECGEDGCIPKRGAIKASKLHSHVWRASLSQDSPFWTHEITCCGSLTCSGQRPRPAPECLCLGSHPSNRHLLPLADPACKELL